MTRKERNEIVNRTVTYAIVCDACGKQGEPNADGWIDFNSHHDEWGNDSCETYKYHDVCSFPCYVAVVRERLDYWNRARSVTVDDRDLTFLTSILATLDEERHS